MMMKAGLLLSVLSFSSAAQAPNCNLAQKAYDNPFSDTNGYWLRRYQWHALRAGGSLAAGEVLHRTSKISRLVSYGVGAFVVGVLPHIRGVSRGSYPFNGRDWIADGVISSLPLVAVVSFGSDGWRPKVLGGALLPAAYFAVACFASP